MGYKLFASVAGFGLCILFFGISVNVYLSFGLLFFGGMFDGVSVVIRHSILQLKTPDELKGRVSSINMMFISSSNELGAFESGLAARMLGTVPSVVFGEKYFCFSESCTIPNGSPFPGYTNGRHVLQQIRYGPKPRVYF